MNPRTTQLFEHLDHHRANLRKTVDEIPPELRHRRPAPERWSAVEILEHLALVERRLTYLFNQWLAEARETGLPPEGETDPGPAVNLEIVLNRGYQVTASEAVQPHGKLDEAAAWTALEEARRDLKALVQDCEGLPLGGIVRPHPNPALGRLNFYQWVEFVGWHEARHTAQIGENGSLLGASLSSLPHLPPEDAAAFEADLTDLRRELDQIPPRDPWES
ncbi:MAG TPA: DinB family protein [Thermoanaerobaculia bacterium]|nr:DinB family protein [Thermoanaerobaculia bacterium]